ncbi:MAG: M48 family metallopeptidase [Rubricoccaceae bacterium]
MPASSARWFVCLVALALGAGCATIGGVNYYSVEQEWELGRQIEAQLNSDLQLVSDRALTQYVRTMGQQMVRAANADGLSWRFYVVADDAINAFNVPGGLVYINTGLIAESGSAAELAGAIAHEVAHGTARHGTKRLSKANEANVVAGAVLGQSGNVAGRVAAQVAAQGAFAKFSRDDEREADRLGVHYMAGAGYDPRGLANLLDRLAAAEQGGGATLFRSHPLSSERRETVERLAQQYQGRSLRMNDRQFSSMRSRAARY